VVSRAVRALSAYDIAAAVVDPELPMLTLADLGVLRRVDADGTRVAVTIAPTYTGCPALAEMRADLASVLQAAGYADVEVRVELDPPWRTDDITPHGRALLAEHGIAPPAARAVVAAPMTFGVRVAAPPCPRCASSDTLVASPFGPTQCTALCRCTSCGEPFEYVRPR
jgi:ring-1,2-phenylacetyl-CoA epoxidase subunit PaaD